MDLDSYYQGYAEALLFAQAHNDVEGGQQVLQSHYPEETWDEEKREWIKLPDFKERLTQTINRMDEEGGVTVFRFVTIPAPWTKAPNVTTDVIEVGSTEGWHGEPEWEGGEVDGN